MSLQNNIDDINIKSDDIWDLIDNLEDNKLSRKNKNKNKNRCNECDSSNIIFDEYEATTVCEDCGLNIDYLLDSNPDWNSINSTEDNNSRCGAPTNFFFPNASLGTKVTNGKFSKIAILEKWNQMPYKERSKYEVFKYIEKKCMQHNVNKPVIDNAKNLFNTLSKVTINMDSTKVLIIRGLNRRSIIAACVYNGSNLQGEPRTPDEIGKIFGITPKQVTKGNRKFRDIMIKENIINKVKSSQSDEFINREEYSKLLKLEPYQIDIAKNIARNIKKLDIASDHQPASIAASSIMLMAEILKLNINKKKISDVYTISQVTIVKAFRKIYPYRKILISNKATDKLLNLSNNESSKDNKLISKNSLIDDNLIEEEEEGDDDDDDDDDDISINNDDNQFTESENKEDGVKQKQNLISKYI